MKNGLTKSTSIFPWYFYSFAFRVVPDPTIVFVPQHNKKKEIKNTSLKSEMQ